MLDLQEEKLKCQMEYMESIKKLEEKMLNQQQHPSNGITDGTYLGEVVCFYNLLTWCTFTIISPVLPD